MAEESRRGQPRWPSVMHLEGADQDQEFADEAVQRRQRQRREADEEEEGHQLRHRRREAAELD